jgi:V8-like Glu-specific endopeptidase
MGIHHFLGDREAPMPLASMRRRRPVLGTRQIPAVLQEMARRRSFYLETGLDAKPEVKTTSVGSAGEQVWRIDVPVSERLRGARAGRTLNRHPAANVNAGVDPAVSYASHRPDWIDSNPMPRLIVDKAARTLRRFDGRRGEPLWVYDNARYAFEDDSWPWGLVGRIFNNRGESGSGTLIGDRLVVTAGHMVPWGDSPWWMQFVPAYFNGTSLFGAGVESYVSDASGYDISHTFIGYDYAILRLYEPLGTSLGYFGYNSYSDAWNNLPVWSNIGYPGDIDNAQEPAFQQGFTIGDDVGDGNGGDELETENCDLNHGNSGGPMFAWWNNGTDPRVAAVVSSQLTNAQQPPFPSPDDNVFAGGDAFANLCAWGRSNWPA